MADLNGVHIFQAGKWNGDTYTESDLDDLVNSFNAIGAKIKPYVKLGHDEGQALIQKDGFPSAGWITNVYKKGKDLFVDIKNMPQKKAYGRVSSEIYWGLKDEDTVYKRVLKGIALLGADTPAVNSLDDFIDLYTENDYEDIKTYTSEVNKMTEAQKVEVTLNTDDIETTLKEYKQELDDLKKENSDLKQYSEKVEFEKREAEVTAFIDKAIEDGKVTPAQRSDYTALALGLKSYTQDGKTVEGSSFEMVQSILNNYSKVELGEESQVAEIESKVYSKEDDRDQGDILDERIKIYSKENNVSYADAYDAIAMED